MPPLPLSPLRLLKPIRDRALDHAVEKEKHLHHFLSLKTQLLSDPQNPLPLSQITLPLNFIRLFPHAFTLQNLSSNPSILPTPHLTNLHSLQNSIFDENRSKIAESLLQLLMLSPTRQIPLTLLRKLHFDIEFSDSLIPHFPHFFHLLPHSLDLVSYRKNLAISSIQKHALRTGGYNRNNPLPFPLHFSNGFQLDKDSRKWLENWQKLPYISPYDNLAACEGNCDVIEKYIVGVLHEVLSLFIGKKTELRNLVMVGKWLGLPSGFARVVKYHHGIFYVSKKLGTETVVLRDAYRRDRLVEKDAMMEMRYRYTHLMRMGRQGDSKKMKGKKSRRRKGSDDAGFGEGEEEDGDAEFDEEEVELSESEEEESDDEVCDQSSGDRKIVTSGFSRNKVSAVGQ